MTYIEIYKQYRRWIKNLGDNGIRGKVDVECLLKKPWVTILLTKNV